MKTVNPTAFPVGCRWNDYIPTLFQLALGSHDWIPLPDQTNLFHPVNTHKTVRHPPPSAGRRRRSGLIHFSLHGDYGRIRTIKKGSKRRTKNIGHQTSWEMASRCELLLHFCYAILPPTFSTISIPIAREAAAGLRQGDSPGMITKEITRIILITKLVYVREMRRKRCSLGRRGDESLCVGPIGSSVLHGE